MNTKLKNNKIYFKLKNNELEAIENNQILVDQFSFDNKTKLIIKLYKAVESSIKLLQKDETNTINCQISPKQIQTLKDLGKNKEGLTIKGKESSFTIQLDLKQRD